MNHGSEILNAEEAAGYLKVHVETLRRLARRGRIPAFKIGKDWRFRRESLLQWADGERQTGRRFDIMIVDDEEDVTTLLSRYLEGSGFGTRAFRSGQDALKYLDKHDVDLVLLDLMMPGISGPAFMRRLEETGRRIPVIVITGHPDSELVAGAMRFGALTLMAKPVGREELIQAVNTRLRVNQENGTVKRGE